MWVQTKRNSIRTNIILVPVQWSREEKMSPASLAGLQCRKNWIQILAQPGSGASDLIFLSLDFLFYKVSISISPSWDWGYIYLPCTAIWGLNKICMKAYDTEAETLQARDRIVPSPKSLSFPFSYCLQRSCLTKLINHQSPEGKSKHVPWKNIR